MNYFADFNTQLEFDGSTLVWDYSKFPPKKIQIQINLTKNNKINYCRDGATLRIDQVKDTTNKYQIFQNFEQIQFFQWLGNFGENNQKIGRWTATWKEENLKNVGGQYSEDGKKQGLWKEIIKNFCNHAKVFEVGEYMNGFRKAIWSYLYNDKEIGGGSYDIEGNGIKIGRWIQLSDDFFQQSQVTYNGEFQNGKKIGRWDILFKGLYQKKFQQILAEVDLMKKERIVLRLEDGLNYRMDLKIILKQFQMENIKMAKKNQDEKEFKQFGCGSYNNGSKTGMWIELKDGFNDYSQITYRGKYKNGNKFGIWSVLYRKFDEKEFKQIGGGFYDELGNGFKIGIWSELNDDFRYNCQLTYHGEYKNGKKVGSWDLFYRKHDEKEFKKIGGGSYNEEDYGNKIGRWIELNDVFDNYSQITENGEYKNGKRVDVSDIMLSCFRGGGSFDQDGDGMKNGRWIDLSYGFKGDYQITYQGEYLKGNKVGRWDILYRKPDEQDFKQIGGGQYDEGGYGIKIGRWIELIEEFNTYSQIIDVGLYEKGKKVGIWVKQGLNYGKQIYKEQKYEN
ncbi:unnamed protein product [Paramecium pentaurelia]|uniref:Uncharacterized protein n=1 Tax=Paramecium pentaurelia TaxID=43138 RepID=A0A8S1YBK5_9CILI|nr:unnamed protein product [Paramecium pentaurelia]